MIHRTSTEAFPGSPQTARKVAALLMHRAGISYADIAAELGWADHSSAWRAAQDARAWELDRPAFRAVVAAVEAMT